MSDPYAEQIRRLAAALAAGAADDLAAVLAAGSTPDDVRLFVEGNRSKRLEGLRAALAFLADAVDDLDPLLEAYLGRGPLPAHVTPRDDALRFLAWAERAADLSPEQLDHVVCQRARLRVEAAATADRAGLLAFQALREAGADLDPDDPDVAVHLNPVRVWARFATTALLDDDAAVPADVLFFAADGDIVTAVLEAEGQALLEEFADLAPCSLESWSAVTQHADREELVEICQDLAGMGLVAFGPIPAE